MASTIYEREMRIADSGDQNASKPSKRCLPIKSSPLKLIAFEQFSPDGVIWKTQTNVGNTGWSVLVKPNIFIKWTCLSDGIANIRFFFRAQQFSDALFKLL